MKARPMEGPAWRPEDGKARSLPIKECPRREIRFPMSAELLARLNPKITSYHARGGIPELTPHDIAAGLAGAPKNAQRTALAAFAGFPEPLLPGLVEARLWRLANAEGWYAPPEQVRRIARIAVWEYCEPPRCGECEGRMIVYTPQPGKCEACNGSGYGRIRASQLCDVLGVSLVKAHRSVPKPG
ncbi:MAG: hypothetical protein ACR2M4_00190 [Actinomycetota bacterium]